MKNSTIIAVVALLVAVAGAAIGLAAFLGKKRRASELDCPAYEFPFDDEFDDDFDYDECDCCTECDCEENAEEACTEGNADTEAPLDDAQ